MSNEKNDFIYADRISINDKRELEYWCEKYNTSPEIMKKTIEAVGSNVKDVERQLRKK